MSVPTHLSLKRIQVIGKEYLPKNTGFTIYSNHNSWDDPRQSVNAITHIVTHVQEGLAMIIYPEGTRNKDVNSLLDFKAGAFKVALRTGKPSVTIILIKKSRMKFFSSVIIKIHKPLLFDEFNT